jgi:AraC family transcriptional regulator
MNQRTLLMDLSTGRTRPLRPIAPARSSAPLNWDGILVEEYEPADSRSNNVALLNSAIYLAVNDSIELDWQSGGKRVSKRIAPGQISILPANHPYSVRLRAAGGCVIVSMMERLLTVAAADQGEFEPVRPVWVHGMEDSLIRELVLTLRDEARSPGHSHSRYVHSLASALAAHLVRRYSTGRVESPERPGGLGIAVLRRTIQFIHDHLDESLDLERLAGVAELSACHFARMFKISTGAPPHRYILTCRIDRARQLLQRGGGSLAEIALLAGFCDQGHLTRCFRRALGITPAAFARGMKGQCHTVR